MDKARHDSNFALAWSDDAWAVWSNHPRLALRLEHVCYANHIVLWNAFSNAYNERDFGFDCFFDAFCG
jgi:hypothetical protein